MKYIYVCYLKTLTSSFVNEKLKIIVSPPAEFCNFYDSTGSVLDSQQYIHPCLDDGFLKIIGRNPHIHLARLQTDGDNPASFILLWRFLFKQTTKHFLSLPKLIVKTWALLMALRRLLEETSTSRSFANWWRWPCYIHSKFMRTLFNRSVKDL